MGLIVTNGPDKFPPDSAGSTKQVQGGGGPGVPPYVEVRPPGGVVITPIFPLRFGPGDGVAFHLVEVSEAALKKGERIPLRLVELDPGRNVTIAVRCREGSIRFACVDPKSDLKMLAREGGVSVATCRSSDQKSEAHCELSAGDHGATDVLVQVFFHLNA